MFLNERMRKAFIVCILLFLGDVSIVSAQYDGENDGEEELQPFEMAERLMRKNMCDKAEAIYRKEYSKDSSKRMFYGIVKSLTCQKRFEEANQLARYAMAIDSNETGNYWYLALNYMKWNQSDSSVFYLKRYISKSEKLAELGKGNAFKGEQPKAWLYIGNIYRIKMHNEGITDKEWIDMVYAFERYLAMNPKDESVFALREFIERVRVKRPEPTEILIWNEH